jgi:metal-responsive CopG/Arc/MetJ family transcriptional regulator
MVDVDSLHKLTKGKTKVITFKINPDLLIKIDRAIKKDKDISSRSGLIERCLLNYLENRGEL